MPDEKPGDNQEGIDSRPDWLEGNFNSVEAQAQAYSNARAEMHRQQQRAQELEQYVTALEEEREQYAAQPQEPQQPEYQAPGLTNPLLLQLRQAREMGDDQTEMAITAYMASQIAEQKIAEAMKNQQPAQQQPDQVMNEFYAYQADALARDQFDRKYGQGEWDAVKADAAQWLATQAPEMIPETLSPSEAAQRIVWAAEYVQGQKLLAGSEEDRNQHAQAQQQRRLLAQTSSGSGTPPPTVESDQERWDRIRSSPVGSYAELRGQ